MALKAKETTCGVHKLGTSDATELQHSHRPEIKQINKSIQAFNGKSTIK